MSSTLAEKRLVSIIITCYNQAQFLAEAIESARAQTHNNCEIIVVDDGSNDITRQVSSRFADVNYVYQSNLGLAAARNKGISLARGEYLNFLDADDRLLPEAVETNLTFAAQNPGYAFVYGNYIMITADGKPLSRPAAHSPDDDGYDKLLRGNYIAMHATVLYRRAVFDSIGVFNAQLKACEDYEIFLRIARRFPFRGHSVDIAEYRQHSGNMSDNGALMLKSVLTVLNWQREYVGSHPEHATAYLAGRRWWKDAYGPQLLRAVKSGNMPCACRALLTLVRYYPNGLARYLVQYGFRRVRALTA
jgi:glycosyltransferase involved in cell wall biosynthesis